MLHKRAELVWFFEHVTASCTLLFHSCCKLNFGGFFNELGKQICTEVIIICVPTVIQGSEDKDSEKFPEESRDAEWVGEKTVGEIDNC